MVKSWVLYLGIAIGIAATSIVWWLTYPHQGPVIAQPPAPGYTQADKSVVVERNAKPPAAVRVQLPNIPAGYQVQRQVVFEIQPDAPKTPGAAPEPVNMDLVLVQNKEGDQRVVLKAEGGTIIKSLDIPTVMPRASADFKYAAGLDYTVTSWGNIKSVVGQRQFGRLVLAAHAGVETLTPPGGGTLRGGAAGVSAIIRF